MNTCTYQKHWIVATLVVSLAATGSGWALGFRNPDQGARATGQGEAFVAQADDASAIYYNPAGLTQQKGTELTSGSYLDISAFQFRGAANVDHSSFSFLPQLYLATDFGKSNSPWRVGLGFNVPFGSKINLGSGYFSNQVIRSSLAVYNIAPSVAYRFNEHFSLGVDLNVYHGETMFEQKIKVPLIGDTVYHFQGQGDAVGATVGALYKFNDRHTLGAVYRSPFTINFADSAALRPGYPNTPAAASINFPQSVAIGYAYRPVAKLKLEVDVEWTNWDPIKTVQVNAGPLSGPAVYNWRDSFYYEFGAQYELNEHWTARAGYIFSENTVPDQQFFAGGVPDADRHVLSVGLGYGTKRLQVDVAYQYSFTVCRTVTGSPNGGLDDGKWTTDGHAICVTSTLHF